MWEILERGDIHFLCGDVRRLSVVLEPAQRGLFRRVVIGRKQLPDLPGERYWGYVDRVARTRGERGETAAHAAGEGVYALFRHADHAHLSYRLELPSRTGDAEGELDLGKEGSYIVAVKNPAAAAPPGIGAPGAHAAHLPGSLQQRFHHRRFIEADPALLDCEGVEVVLIATGEDIPAELDVHLQAERETHDTADVFAELGWPRRIAHPTV